MAQIKATEMKFLVSTLQMEAGYVLDFTDRTFSEFFSAEVGVNIDEKKYLAQGTSKAKRLKFFLLNEADNLAATALRGLWEYREDMGQFQTPQEEKEITRQRYFEIIERIEGAGPALAGAIERFAESATLDELVTSIERDIQAHKPQVALDRLHTYCMKKFAHLLRQRGEEVSEKDTLNGRAGRYFNPLRRGGNVRPISEKIMRNTVETFELLNTVRNKKSLAHDNELMEHAEAHFVFDSVLSLLRFVRSMEADARADF
jgi:hypothetical protein